MKTLTDIQKICKLGTRNPYSPKWNKQDYQGLWIKGYTLSRMRAECMKEYLRQQSIREARAKARYIEYKHLYHKNRYLRQHLAKKDRIIEQRVRYTKARETWALPLTDIIHSHLNYCHTQEIYRWNDQTILVLTYEEECVWGKKRYPIKKTITMYAELWCENGTISKRNFFNRRGNWQKRLIDHFINVQENINEKGTAV